MLSINDLHVKYKANHALKGVSLTVNQGEIVSLIGSNGAGKSSLIKAVSGMVTPAQGEIHYKQKSIMGLPSHVISKMGILHVPEGGGVFLSLTVEENLIVASLATAKQNQKQNMELVYQLFPRLFERRTFTGKSLSGGERRMLAMGMALMTESELLLLDEPSIGLSPILVETIFETIVKIRDQGKSILLVEQNAAQALFISNRGYVLQEGLIVVHDDAAKLLEDDNVRKAYLGG
ncbi:ABC transporter ATP-binding protein [Brevibacillus marinus]|uniref:ABC transporter ATP-binding protein n=1 Tax=Brevibacillus marinus TaxID=2496837 RepID=UPI000F8225F2|nr:ABC transporter ATP-binding protein [Brevibacillus marinus]